MINMLGSEKKNFDPPLMAPPSEQKAVPSLCTPPFCAP